MILLLTFETYRSSNYFIFRCDDREVKSRALKVIHHECALAGMRLANPGKVEPGSNAGRPCIVLPETPATPPTPDQTPTDWVHSNE